MPFVLIVHFLKHNYMVLFKFQPNLTWFNLEEHQTILIARRFLSDTQKLMLLRNHSVDVHLADIHLSRKKKIITCRHVTNVRCY